MTTDQKFILTFLHAFYQNNQQSNQKIILSRYFSIIENQLNLSEKDFLLEIGISLDKHFLMLTFFGYL